MTYPPTLSVCIITLNEEDNIERCIQSTAFADEVIVVDSGSTDRTEEIAKSLGAEIHHRRFDGFVNQKNFAITLAKGKWVLVVDADEVVTPGLRLEIENAVKSSKETAVAYRIPRMSLYLGRWIRHSGWYPDYNIRLFMRHRGRFEGGTVHEELITSGSVGTMRHHLQHYSYGSISDHLSRMDHYSTLIAQDKYRRGRQSSVLWALGKGVSKFFLTYFWRLGFLDGRAGLVIAVLGSYYNFLKYMKLWELNRGLVAVAGSMPHDVITKEPLGAVRPQNRS